MSSQSYIFNAPPPPPPVAAVTFNDSSKFRDSRNGYRERHVGSQRGNYRGVRGPGPRGNFDGRAGRHGPNGLNNFQGQRTQHDREEYSHSDRPAKRARPGGSNWSQPGISSSSTSAIKGNAPRTKLPGPTAAPAVPSFNSIIPMLAAPSKPEIKVKEQEKTKPKAISLGLIPVDEPSADEVEGELVDEEAAISNGIMVGTALLRSGKSISLRDPVQLATWVKERREAFPSKQRREDDETRVKAARAAKSLAIEERRKAIEKARLENIEKSPLESAQKGRLESVARNRPKKDTKISSGREEAPEKSAHPIKKERSKRNRGKGKLKESGQDSRKDLLMRLKSQDEELARLRALIEGPKGSKPGNRSLKAQTIKPQIDIDQDDLTSSSGSSLSDSDSESDTESDSEHTSSSSSSSSEPEQVSSRPSGPVRVAAPPRQGPRQSERPPCQAFMEGRCSLGTRCSLNHPKGVQGRRLAGVQRRRKGLFQKLVESEKAEEERRLVQFVKELGEGGVLEEMRKEIRDGNKAMAG